jgi:hypothetical protein
VDVVWTLLFVAAMGAMWWGATRLEPHYSSKDGRRFMCTAQEIIEGELAGRPRETRVIVMTDGALHCSQKRMMRRSGSLWAIVGKSPAPPRKLDVYLLRELADGREAGGQMAVRIPRKSRVVPILDGILANRGVTPGLTAPETA